MRLLGCASSLLHRRHKLLPVIDATSIPETPGEPLQPSRVWRMVLLVVSAQLVLIAVGMVLFNALSFADAATGGCGGG